MERQIWHVAVTPKGTKRSFFHWAGHADTSGRAAQRAMDDMQAAWEAVAAGAGHARSSKPRPPGVLVVKPKSTLSATDATLMHLPLWSIGSAMLNELPLLEAKRPDHGAILAVLGPLARSEVARHAMNGLRGTLSITLKANDTLAERRNEIECGAILAGTGVEIPEGHDSWLLPAITRAASSLMAMRIGARSKAAGPFMMGGDTESSSTLAAAAAARDAIWRNLAVIEWYRGNGMESVARELESLEP